MTPQPQASPPSLQMTLPMIRGVPPRCCWQMVEKCLSPIPKDSIQSNCVHSEQLRFLQPELSLVLWQDCGLAWTGTHTDRGALSVPAALPAAWTIIHVLSSTFASSSEALALDQTFPSPSLSHRQEGDLGKLQTGSPLRHPQHPPGSFLIHIHPLEDVLLLSALGCCADSFSLMDLNS